MDRFIRPKMLVVSDTSVIPAQNLITPPPTTFTHKITVAQPYYYSRTKPDQAPDGEFPPETPVVLLSQNGSMCRVIDERGLYVETSYSGLRLL